jgi:aspartate-semialdehyde dehydrogenase
MRGDARVVAVVGATGIVGQEILSVLAERQFPVADVRAMASGESEGNRVAFGARQLRVVAVNQDELRGAHLVFFAADTGVSRRFASATAAAGAAVIDLSGCFMDDADRRLVTAAGGPAVPLAAVLGPIAAAAGLRRVCVATYEPASGIGRAGVSEMSGQAIDLLHGRGVEAAAFTRQIGFNCIPAVGALDAEGHSESERLLATALRRVLDRPALAVIATAVRVPVFFGLGVAAAVETERPLAAGEARRILREAPGILLSDDEAGAYTTPVEAVGTDAVHVGRVRSDPSVPAELCLWAAIDNVRKGAALNAVEIAEIALREWD